MNRRLHWDAASETQPAPMSEHRFALIIGNNAYKHNPLANACNDAELMHKTLVACGFQVTALRDADNRTLTEAVKTFATKLPHGERCVTLFYFAGHGIQHNGENYLLPTDANPATPADLAYETLPFERVRDNFMHHSWASIFILDACRDNPLPRSFARTGARGLALRDMSGSGYAILYATEANKTAADGAGRHGLFTEKLVAEIQKPGQKLEDVFKATRNAVDIASRNAQRPQQLVALSGDFYFIPPTAPAPVTVHVHEDVLYQKYRKQGDTFAHDEDWENAIQAYEDALEQIPEDEYCARKLAFCKKKFAQPTPSYGHPSQEGNTKAPLLPDEGGIGGVGGGKNSQPPPAPPIFSAPLQKQEGRQETPLLPDEGETEGATKTPLLPAGIGGAGGGKTETIKGVSFSLIKIPNRDYYMAETPVTQALYEAVMGENPSRFKGDTQRPVENVSWHDAQHFLKKLNVLTGKNYRLPTEEEWEYAARGGEKYEYAGSNDLDEVSWYWENSGGKRLSGKWDATQINTNNCRTHPVKGKKPNAYGLYDMSGNVWEWCEDWHDKEQKFRVLRGGSWYNVANNCSVAKRGYDAPGLRNDGYGFRVVH